jgi:hypothetical protein
MYATRSKKAKRTPMTTPAIAPPCNPFDPSLYPSEPSLGGLHKSLLNNLKEKGEGDLLEGIDETGGFEPTDDESGGAPVRDDDGMLSVLVETGLVP